MTGSVRHGYLRTGMRDRSASGLSVVAAGQWLGVCLK